VPGVRRAKCGLAGFGEQSRPAYPHHLAVHRGGDPDGR
jgi:hypothetical protein